MNDIAQDTAPAENENASEKLVPVTEAIRYRRRAQAAEQSLQEMRSTLDKMKSDLDAANQTIDRLDRRGKIDALLREADTIDLEAGRLLTEIAIDSMAQPDVRAAVDELRRAKPYLFHRRASNASGALAPAAEESFSPTHAAAQDALHTGDRRDLLRYLRLRRKA